MARLHSGRGDPVVVLRSNRLPAMIRMPGPSQVSRARASSVVVAVVDAVASGVSRRSLTTMTRRPSGTSIRAAPGSGSNATGSSTGRRSWGLAPTSGWVVDVTALPS